MSIREWLALIGLEHLAPSFEDQHISVEVLPYLSEEELIAVLGVTKLGDRKRIARAIASPSTTALPPTDPPPQARPYVDDWAALGDALDVCLTKQCALALQPRRLRGWLQDELLGPSDAIDAVCAAAEFGALTPLLNACDGSRHQRSEAQDEALACLRGDRGELREEIAQRVIELWAGTLGIAPTSGSRSASDGETRRRRERAVRIRLLVRLIGANSCDDDEGGVRCPVSVGLGNIHRALLPTEEEFEELVQQFLLRQGETIGAALDPRYMKYRIVLAADEPVELTVFDGTDFRVVHSTAWYRQLLPNAAQDDNSWRIGLSIDDQFRVYLHAEDDAGASKVSDLGVVLAVPHCSLTGGT